MASKTDRERVLTGGMELLNPGDKQAPGNSLLVENFRPDAGDRLQSRFGSVKTAGPVGSGTFHTLRSSDSFGGCLAGIGINLYGNDAALSTLIDTGYDGQPLGIAYFQGSAWVMNRARQSRLLGSLMRERWGVLAPATAPTATGGGQLSTLIDEYDDTAALSVGIDSPPSGADPFTDYALKNGATVSNPTASADIDGSNFRSGSGSLRIVANAATSVTAYVSLSDVDLRVDGKDGDNDVIRVWVFASNPAAVDRVTVYVRSGQRTDPDHGYVEYSFDASKFLNQSLNSWTQLKIRRRLNLDDWSQRSAAAAAGGIQQTVSDIEAQFATAIQTPTFVYTGTGWPQSGIGAPPAATYPPSQEMLNLDWSDTSEFGVTFKLNQACQVGLDRSEVIGTVGEDSSGAIQYFVSFENEDGQDGNPSPASNSVIAGNQTITLNGVAISPDANTRARKIWRIGGGLSQAYMVGRLWGNASTGPFVDGTTNRQAQADNLVMPVARDLPPAARGVLGPVFGKLIAYNSDEHPARYWWTDSARPWYFPGANDDLVGNWEDAGGDEEGILAATDHKQMVLFYKAKSIWRLAGDPVTTDPVKTNSQVGAVGPNAVTNAGSIDYFVGSEGIYSFNGDFETKISRAIDSIFKGHHAEINDFTIIPPVNPDQLSKTTIAVIGDRLRVSYAEGGSSVANVVILCHLPTGNWTRETYAALAEPAFTIMHYSGAGGFLWAGVTAPAGAYLYYLEQQGFIDDTHPITVKWQSRYSDQGIPDSGKVYTEIEIDFTTVFGTTNSTLAVAFTYDNGKNVFLGNISSSDLTHGRQTSRLTIKNEALTDIGRLGKNGGVYIQGDVINPVTIFGIYLHWYAEERVAKTFDTGPTHCGIPERVKEIDYLEFYMTSQGQQLSKVISSDLPGGVLTHRDTAQMTAPAGRGTSRFRLTSPIDGRNFRMYLDDDPSGVPFQVHQARARMRVIGEYIDGTIGEYFECPEFSIAPGRVGELKDLLLDYDSTGDGRIEIYSDLPGNALALQRTITLPQQARSPRMLPFETPSLSTAGGGSTALPYGQLFKIRVYPPSNGVVRLHGRAQLRARVIGVYFDGTRGEIWETQALDLLGGMAVFREISIVSQSEGTMYLEFRTELPGQNISTVASFEVNPSATTAGRLPFIGRLPGTAKGRLQQIRLVGPHVARVLECKVMARRIQGNDTPWDWIPIPLEPTPDQWVDLNMPVRATPEAFEWIEIPVDEIA